MVRAHWSLRSTILVVALFGFGGQVTAEDQCPSPVFRFWIAGGQPDAGHGSEVSEVRFLSDGQRLLHRNGLDTSDFVVLPKRDGRGHLTGETYQRTSDKTEVLQIDFERRSNERITHEYIRLPKDKEASDVLPSPRLVGWYIYEWDQSGRLSTLTFLQTRAPDYPPADADGFIHHKITFSYDGNRRNPREATILRPFPAVYQRGVFQPFARLHFLYDDHGRLVGARDDGNLRVDVGDVACDEFPERLLPIMLNPFGGPWSPTMPNRRLPGYIPSLPR